MIALSLFACRPDPTGGDSDPALHTAASHTALPTPEHTGAPPTAETGDAGPVVVTPGAWCAPEDSLGVVQILASPYGPTTVWGQLWDRPEPTIGAPARTTSTCEYHEFDPGSCGTCPAGEVCGVAGCTPQPRTEKDVTFELRAGGESHTYTSDPVLGTWYGELDLGTPRSSFGATLTWDGWVVELPPMPIASGDLGEVHVTAPSSEFFRPGGLDATWDPPADGGVVRSRIAINHHASGATFTECAVDAAAGSFHADAPMIDPLAVITGLEFQGLEHWQTAAATLPHGCVDLRFGRLLYLSVELP